MKYVVLAVAIAACGSKGAAPSTTGPASTTKRAPLPPGLVWKDMNLDQRHQFMEETVMPRMKEQFVAFDAAEFGNMDCKTCHGAGVEDGTFEMPNPKIKPLPSTPEAFMAWLKADARAAKFAPFMGKVETNMGELLQLKLFDPKTGSPGFGCSNCHYLVDESGKVFKAPEQTKTDNEHQHG